jgi:subtilisin family serine protease
VPPTIKGLCAIAAAWAVSPPAPGAGLDEPGGHATTHVVVQLRRGVSPLDLGDAMAAPGALGRAEEIRPVFEDGFARQRLAQRYGLDRFYRMSVPAGTDVIGFAAELAQHGTLVQRAEPDGIGSIADTLPGDPDFGLQWGLLNTGQSIGGQPGTAGADINVAPAWDLVTGDPDLVLAVLDAGMDEHEELVSRTVPGRNVAAEPDNDDTSDVCISHGTHVAGIAAAAAGNAIGVAGVDWQCRIMPVRVLESCGGPESFLAEGIVWAADNGADVINMSLQYFDGTAALHSAVQYAYAAGVVLIAASGNQGAGAVAYPARWPETIAAGAITNVGDRWSLSNGGPNLDVMAPGADVWSLKGAADYQFLSGTSMAAPHVSGVAMLLLARDPGLSSYAIKATLQETAADLDAPGFDEQTGFGRIDAAAAVATLAVTGDLDGDGTVSTADLLVLLGAWGPCDEPCPPACPADLDGDCFVGTADLLTLLANWG